MSNRSVGSRITDGFQFYSGIPVGELKSIGHHEINVVGRPVVCKKCRAHDAVYDSIDGPICRWCHPRGERPCNECSRDFVGRGEVCPTCQRESREAAARFNAKLKADHEARKPKHHQCGLCGISAEVLTYGYRCKPHRAYQNVAEIPS